LEVGGEEGQGALKVVDSLEIEVAFFAGGEGVVKADYCLCLFIYLQWQSEKCIHQCSLFVVIPGEVEDQTRTKGK
jgi:hypothetical protein